MLDPTSAILATVFLGIGGITIWIVAVIPQLYPVWFNRDPLGVIAKNMALWHVGSSLFLISAFTTLIGVALAFPIDGSPLAPPTLLLLGVATALWATDLALRFSVIAKVAVNRSSDAEVWLDRAQAWSTAAWYIAAGCLILVFGGLGAIVLTTGVLAAWAGWVCLASAAFSTIVFVVTRDAAPIVIYQPVLPLAVATLLAALSPRN